MKKRLLIPFIKPPNIISVVVEPEYFPKPRVK